MGRSGCGKSTLLQLIAGLVDPMSGTVKVGGHDMHAVRGAARDRLRGRSIGMVFQTFNLLQGFTARENVLVALLMSDVPKSEWPARAEGLLRSLGIERLDARVEELSVGQQQRVAVARALVLEPAVLLFDEPLSNLDAKLRRRVRQEIRELQQSLQQWQQPLLLLLRKLRPESRLRFRQPP